MMPCSDHHTTRVCPQDREMRLCLFCGSQGVISSNIVHECRWDVLYTIYIIVHTLIVIHAKVYYLKWQYPMPRESFAPHGIPITASNTLARHFAFI
ncbi:hypothetical protein BDV36DRAFT_237667 [Aspergillus pseudocaelatus]|uniref:Uncharacterized protein n=1 Tax=Aspergillus pseudocaelatus TaxID=1825620 RepID=A0ABQ6WC61_9EURO|nr:hypothetical protein BDV36DRAFT_237667 [Aspergillus pseudocaelatus]